MNQRDAVAIKAQANCESLPNYYGLLRLNLFEPDRILIARALRSRVDLTKSFQSDTGTRDQQRLLNQLGDAQRCLLDPVAKSRVIGQALSPPSTTENRV